MLQNPNKPEKQLEKQRSSFANYLRSMRIDCGLPQKDLADLAGISRTTMSSYEHAKVIPTPYNLEKILHVFEEAGIEDYKLKIMRDKHIKSVKASDGRTIGRILRG